MEKPPSNKMKVVSLLNAALKTRNYFPTLELSRSGSEGTSQPTKAPLADRKLLI